MNSNIIHGKLRLKGNVNLNKKMKRIIEKTTNNSNTEEKNNKQPSSSHKDNSNNLFKSIKHEPLKESDDFLISTNKISNEDNSTFKECENKIDLEQKELQTEMTNMTAAEKLFYERKLKMMPQKIHLMARTSFKEKYQQYYKSLTKLPEHHDIPKVGPG